MPSTKTNLPDHVCLGKLTAWLQDNMYVEGNLQDDIVKYSRNFKVLISLPESRRFVYNHQCTTTQMALPLNNLFFV